MRFIHHSGRVESRRAARDLTGRLLASVLCVMAFVGPEVARGAATDGQWKTDADGTWGTAGNWNGSVPDGNGIAWFSNQNISASRQITIASAIELSGMNISNANGAAYTFITNAGGVFQFTKNGASNPVFRQDSIGAANLNMNITLGDPATITGDGAGLITINGVISGAKLFTKSGASTLILNGANLNSSGLTMSGGVLEFGNNGAAGTGTLTLSGGVLRAGGAARSLTNAVTISADFAVAGANDLTLSGPAALGAVRTFTITNTGLTTLSGIVSGAGGVVKAGSEVLVLSGANTYSGATIVSNGTLRLGANNVLPGTAVTVISGATNDFNNFTDTIGSLAGDGAVALGSGYLTTGGDNTSTLFGGVISGGGGFTKAGSGTMTLTNASTYTGATTNSAGTLLVTFDQALGTTAGDTVVVSGATVGFSNAVNYATAEQIQIAGAGVGGVGALANLSGNNTFAGAITNTAAATIGSIDGTFSLTGAINNAGNALTFTNAAGASIEVNGAISGSGALRNLGDGSTVLLANNTFTGNTLVSAGTLNLQAAGALGGTTNVTVNAGTLLFSGGTGVTDRINDAATMTFLGGTLESTDYTETFGILSLGANSIFNLGSGGGQGALTFSNAVWTAGTLTINNWAATDPDNPGLGGSDDRFFMTVDPGAGFLTNIFFSGFGLGATRLGTGEIAPLVTPSTWTGAGGDNLWGTSANWSPAGTPAEGKALTLTGSSGQLTNTIDGAAAAKYGGMTFAATAPGSFLIGGNALTNGSGGIVNRSSYLQSFNNAALVLSAKQSWNAATNSLFISAGVTNSGYQLTLTGTSNITVAGVINGSGGLYKSGTGTAILSGANLYTGGTTNEAGTLIVTVNNALGTAGSGTVILSGGTLAFSNSVNYSTAEALTISGTGVGGQGVLDSLGGSNTFAGAVTMAANSRIGASAGELVFTNTIANGGFLLTVTNAAGATVALNGVVSGGGGLGKRGAGTLTLNAVNTYGGGTTISNGVLLSGIANVLPDTTAVKIGADGILDLNSFSETIGSLAGSGTVRSGGGTLTTGGDNSSTTFSGVITNSLALVKAGTGTMILSGANTFTNAVTINAGVLNIQNSTATGTAAGGVTVAGGAALELQGGITVGAEALAITLTGVSGNGALRNISGDNTWGGTVTLSGASTTIQSDAGSLTLNAANAITAGNKDLVLEGAGNGTVSGTITIGVGTLTKNDAGTWILSGANTLTGAITVNGGALNIQHATGAGTTAGGVTVADGAALELQGGAVVGAEALSITGTGVSGNGALRNISGNNAWGGTVTLSGASTIQSDAGIMTLSNAAAVSATAQNLTLEGAGNGVISGVIATTSGTVTKNDAGTWTLSGANTYTGATTVNGGALVATVNNALGTVAGATAVNSGGTLGFSNTVSYTTAEAVTINGAGAGGRGAIDNLGGSNTFAGAITLAANSTVGGTTGYLDLQGAIVNAGNWLTVTNLAASTNVFSGVVSGAGGLTKVGDGTLILTGASANLFSGATTNAAGTLVLQKPEGTDAIAGNLVLTGGTLLLGASNQIANTSAITMKGGATLRTGGYSDTVGVLTLEGNSVIDMSGTASILNFSDSSGATWLAGTLEIDNYTGANDQLYFGSADTALTSSQLSQIIFKDPDGVTGYFGAQMVDANGRVTPNPVPEPSGIVAGILLIPMLLRRAWRRMMRGL